MTDDAQRQLEALTAANEERARLTDRLRALESEREALEAAIEQADARVEEAALDRSLARLGSIERERARIQQALEGYRDLDHRYATALHHKYERLVETAPNHPVLEAIEPLFAEGHQIREQLAALKQDLHCASDAEYHLRLLRDVLGDADTLNTMDQLTSLLPLEVAFGVGKQRLLRSAREHGARARDALARLSTHLELRRQAAQAAGPTPPFGLDDADVALLDCISGDADFWMAYSTSKWSYASRKLQQSIALGQRAMHEQRRRLESRLADITREYQRLITSA